MVTNTKRHPYIYFLIVTAWLQKVNVGMPLCISYHHYYHPCFGAFLWLPSILQFSYCRKVYISETTCQLGTRLKEHKDACIKGSTDKSAIAWTEDNPIRWNDTRILQHVSRTMELVVKEAICIRTTPESLHFNHDGGYDIPDCWITTYQKLKGGTCTGRTHPTTS